MKVMKLLILPISPSSQKMATTPLLLLLVIFAHSFTSIFSRTLPKTTELNVSFCLQQAQHVLSFNPDSISHITEQQEAANSWKPSRSSSFSLQLHHRDYVRKTKHKDYKSLVMSRLARDSPRVDALTAKLRLPVSNVTHDQNRTKELTNPVVSGTSQGSGDYFCRVGIGSPAKQQFYLILDTGSDVNWVQCEPCINCYQQSDPVFDPTASSTYSPLSCDSKQCSSLESPASCGIGNCLYQVSYGDGSYTIGDFVTETVTLGNSGDINGIALGCGHNNGGSFTGAAGLLGLGGGSVSLTNQINATSFSYCLVDRDSNRSSSLEFNSPQPSDSVTTPLLRNPRIDTFYYVGLTGFSVGGKMVQIPPSVFKLNESSGNGGTIVDSGTTITRLPTKAYNLLRDAFVKQTRHLRSVGGVSLFDTCYDLSSRKKSVSVPTVAFHFTGGKTLNLPAKNYLIAVDSNGTFCFAFAGTSSSLSIIGNVQQQGMRVTFDLGDKNVGFSPHKC